jgi:plastocyanin
MGARASSVCIVAMALASVLAGAPPAVAGGCSAPSSHGTGTTVEIVDACFQPSLLSIEQGTTVTFVNRDDFEHNVGGQGWGRFDSLLLDQRFRATFRDEGIYPFACTIHPGMTGAIIVGDGHGPANGHAVTVSPLRSDPPPPLTAASAIVGSDGLPIMLVAVAALLAGFVVGLAAAAYRTRAAGGRLTLRSAHP